MIFVWPVIPDTGMLDFCEAVVVRTLYSFSQSPDKEGVLTQVGDEIHWFTQLIRQNKATITMLISDGEIQCYSKSNRLPLKVADALDRIKTEDTSDLLFFDHDLLSNDRYAGNTLPDVTKNAKAIIANSVEVQLCFTTISIANTQLNIPCDTSRSNAGRPQTRHKKSKLMQKLIEQFEIASGIQFNHESLPGSPMDLLEACQQIESAVTKKKVIFGGIVPDTFSVWLEAAGFSFRNGRPKKSELKFWTQLLGKTIGKTPPTIFSDFL